MNLIVDINPYLIKKYNIEKFTSDFDLKCEDYLVDINESAINASRIMEIFDIDSKLFTVLGGSTGQWYERILKSEINDYHISFIRDEIMENIKISDGSRNLSIFTRNPRITNEEINKIYSDFIKIIESVNFVALIDSEENEISEEIYANLISMAYKSGVKIGVCASPSNIKKIIQSKPYLLVLNKETIEEYAQGNLNFNWEINKICNGIIDSGVGKILFYDDKNNLQLFTKDYIYRAENNLASNFDKMDKVKILSGYVAAISRRYDEEMSLSIALASNEVELKRVSLKRDASDVKSIIKGIEVERLNVTR